MAVPRVNRQNDPTDGALELILDAREALPNFFQHGLGRIAEVVALGVISDPDQGITPPLGKSIEAYSRLDVARCFAGISEWQFPDIIASLRRVAVDRAGRLCILRSGSVVTNTGPIDLIGLVLRYLGTLRGRSRPSRSDRAAVRRTSWRTSSASAACWCAS